MSLSVITLSTTNPVPGFYIVPSIPILDARTLGSSNHPAINTGISQSPEQQSSTSLLAGPLSDEYTCTVTYPKRREIETQEHSTGQLFKFPLDDWSFSRWHVELLFPLLARDTWNGSDAYNWRIENVCQNMTAALDIFCHENYTKRQDAVQQWTCDVCFLDQDHLKLEEHCHKVGERSTLFLHIMVGFLVASTSLSLIVWLIIMCTLVRDGPEAKVERWYQKWRIGSRKAKQDEERPKPNKLQKTKSRKKRGLVPIMPPAPSLFLSRLRMSQVHGNAPDIEPGLIHGPLGQSTHSVNRAVSSGVEPSRGSVASRRPSLSCCGGGTADCDQERDINASGPSRAPRPAKVHLDDGKLGHSGSNLPCLQV